MSRIPSITGSSTPAADKPRDLKDLDLDQFLQLIVTELTNQDPLNPMDNTQLVEQISQLRQISATGQLSDTLNAVATGQALSSASAMIGKNVNALTEQGETVSGVVERVTVQVDDKDNNKRTYRLHVGSQEVDLRNVREVSP